MKITEVKAYPLRAQLDTPRRTGVATFTANYSTLVRVSTDAGIEGWGECLARYAPTAWANLVDEVFGPMLVGEDPWNVERLWHLMYRGLGSFSGHSRGIVPEVIAGIDIALWDIVGKDAGEPLHRMLGGYGRAEVACYGSSIAVDTLENRIEQMEHCLAQGFTSAKVKLGTSVEEDISTIQRLSEVAAGRATLSVDTNGAYRFAEAVRLGDALYELGIAWFEEPFPTEDRASYVKLRSATKVPIAAGEGEFTRWGAKELLDTGAVDIIQPDVARSGGITETRRIVSLASTYHVAYAPHVGGTGAIGAVASLHLASALPPFESYEFVFHENALRTELIEEEWTDVSSLVEGRARVPTGPGLGVTVRTDIVEKYLVK